MAKSAFYGTLDRFKANEQPEAVLLVASDKDYVNIVTAWTCCSIRVRKPTRHGSVASDADAWQWLWDNAAFSMDALRNASGVPAERFESRLDTLIANRVIYPDGTVNSFVRRYLRERVLRLLGVDASIRRSLLAPADAHSDPAS
jgi:hypothetical protein